MRRLGVLAVDVAFLAALIDRAIAESKLLGEMNHDVDTPAAA